MLVILRKISPLLCGLSLAALSFFSPMATAQIKPASQFPTIELTAGIYLVKAEVAANEPDREQGLMYRTQLPANQGMLFIFEQPAGHCFWMKNTFLPLSIAFLADDGTIVNIERMAPQTESNHCPTQPVRFALEMNQGWFSEKGIKPGMRIAGLPQPR